VKSEARQPSTRRRRKGVGQQAGGMDPLLWDGQASSIDFSLKTSPVDPGSAIDRESLTYQVRLERLGNSSAFRVDRERLANYHRVEAGEKEEPFKLIERDGLRARVFAEEEHGLVAPEESLSEEETLLSMSAGPFAANKHIPPF